MTRANDSVLVTPGSGAVIATHLVSAKELQAFLAASSDGNVRGTKDSYVASYKLATDTAQSSIAVTFVTANTDAQVATIHHAASATKTVKIRRVEFYLATQGTTAHIANVELRRLDGSTLPSNGNPAVTPRACDPASPAAEATCLVLPTVAGSVPAATPLLSQEINFGAAAVNTIHWPPDPVVLWPAEGDGVDEVQDLIIRAGVAEGFAVSLRTSVALNVVPRATVRIIFTEHTP